MALRLKAKRDAADLAEIFLFIYEDKERKNEV